MKILKNNIIPILLTLAVTAGLFFILSYISYDIYSYKPEYIPPDNRIKGRIETEEYIVSTRTENLEEFYKEPELIIEQPELPQKRFSTDDEELYKWLGLKNPKEIKERETE